MTGPVRALCNCLIHRETRAGDPEVDVVVGLVISRRWAIVEDGRRAFCTVGQWHNFAHPEFVICGLPRPESRDALRAAVNAMGHGLPRLGEVDIELTSRKVKTVKVHESWHGSPLLRTARAFYCGELPEYRQLIWAEDAEGFPGDEGFDKRLLGRQPNLAIPPPDHPKCAWTAARQAGPGRRPRRRPTSTTWGAFLLKFGSPVGKKRCPGGNGVSRPTGAPVCLPVDRHLRTVIGCHLASRSGM
ncbi:DUF4262 domain-containing protein [Spirillospora sp. CA-108201]